MGSTYLLETFHGTFTKGNVFHFYVECMQADSRCTPMSESSFVIFRLDHHCLYGGLYNAMYNIEWLCSCIIMISDGLIMISNAAGFISAVKH